MRQNVTGKFGVDDGYLDEFAENSLFTEIFGALGRGDVLLQLGRRAMNCRARAISLNQNSLSQRTTLPTNLYSAKCDFCQRSCGCRNVIVSSESHSQGFRLGKNFMLKAGRASVRTRREIGFVRLSGSRCRPQSLAKRRILLL
ncbi:hypothetical protein [Pseudoduganella lurida]|uniref:hypothetical protein n=1 Tax=Pseudoduganella lurida TaxID=1036180 RepID=UPI0011AA167F|nr:hypothetical protein [Pseudoduganella lurida]